MPPRRMMTIEDVAAANPRCNYYYRDDTGRIGFRVRGNVHWYTLYPVRGWIPTGFDMRLPRGVTRHKIERPV